MTKEKKEIQNQLYMKAEDVLSDVLTDALLQLTHKQYVELQMELVSYICSRCDIHIWSK